MYIARTNEKRYVLLTATHSITSTYFGNTTIVLKFPFTRAASTKGLQRYNGLLSGADGADGVAAMAMFMLSGGNVVEVGVGERFGARGARPSFRLYQSQ